MTITDGGVHKGKFRVKAAGEEYMAVRLREGVNHIHTKSSVCMQLGFLSIKFFESFFRICYDL